MVHFPARVPSRWCTFEPECPPGGALSSPSAPPGTSLDVRHDARMERAPIDFLEAGYTAGWSEWRVDWNRQKQGHECVLCRLRGVQEDEWGIRVFTGSFADGYLWKRGTIPGYSVAVWKHEHVAEPTQVSDEQTVGYWLDVVRFARALESVYRPTKMNYQTLGNNVPHLHTHIVPRPTRDPAPNGPLPWAFLDEGRQDQTLLKRGADGIRQALGEPPLQV